MGGYRTTTGEAPPRPPGERRRRRRRLALLSAAAAAALAAALVTVPVPRRVAVSGFVSAEEYAEIRPAVEGVVAGILAGSGRLVERGELLVRLEDGELRAQREQLLAQRRALEARLRLREAEIAEAQRAWETAVAVAGLRERDAAGRLARARELHGRGLVSEAVLEEHSLAQQLAAAELAARRGRDGSLGARELEFLRLEIEAQAEGAARVEAQLQRREIRAPFAGRLVRYEFSPGELVRTDMVLFEIFGGGRQVLKLRVPERHATRVAPGQGYRARLASYRGVRPVRFEGRIEGLRDVIQGDGRGTYRTAYASFEAGPFPVPPGTTAEARILTGRARLGQILLGLD